MEDRRTIHIEIDGESIPINARVQGDGPVILFIHGWLASTHVWRDIFGRFPAGYRLIAIDLPGFGDTAPLHNGPITISHYATVIGLIMDKLSTKGNIRLVVADSFGAIAVLNLMKMASLPTSAVMLSGCPIDGLPKGISILKRKGVVKNTLRVLRALPTKTYHRIARIYSRVIWGSHRPFEPHLADGARAAEPGTAENLIRELFAPFPLDAPVMNQNITALVVRGQNDKIAPEDSAKRLAQYLKGQYFEVSNSGHTPMMENPDAYLEAVSTILKQT